MIEVIRTGLRNVPEGEGTLLHYSPRAMNIYFNGRVVTLLNRKGVLTPSSIILNVDFFPKIERAFVRNNVFECEQFSFKTGEAEDLKLATDGYLDVDSAKEIVSKYVVKKDRSIMNALLAVEGKLDITEYSGLEKIVLEAEVRVIRESGTFEELTKKILGIGFGLTPSGDDFVLGIISILLSTGNSVEEIRPIVREYGNAFSRTMLTDGLDGYFPSTLLSVIESLPGRNRAEKEIETLLETGHTSGHDMLAGMYYALIRLSGSI